MFLSSACFNALTETGYPGLYVRIKFPQLYFLGLQGETDGGEADFLQYRNIITLARLCLGRFLWFRLLWVEGASCSRYFVLCDPYYLVPALTRSAASALRLLLGGGVNLKRIILECV